MPLGVIGFGVAIWQIQQAKTAAENAQTAADAAKTAAEDARGQFKAVSLTTLLPQLRSMEELVDRAIQDKARDLAAHLLQDWRWHASTCREYLDEEVEAEAEAMVKIQKSLIAASTLKSRFFEFDADTDWVKETRPFRKAMIDVTTDLGALSAQQIVKEPK
ncbi:Uncharacterised protein [Mycobacteroides abscessus subsp. bolletii]|nr:Uncharacterised protein [Mycobacteroides abscessus subsp. bolletii]SLD72356.1 Uncharacterised protein [Mycobacteroides abscessus subsp. bolletii]